MGIELVYKQYNISDRLVLKFYAKIKAFVVIKKRVLYFSFNFTRVLASPILK